MLTAMWLQGLESALPAAGVASRVYFATDTGRIFVDSGSAWVRNNLVHRGTYAGGTTYYDKDLVSYNGDVWRALTTVTGVTPVEGGSWTIFVAKGATGSAGSGIASVDGVSNNGGNVDFVAGTNMTITPDDTANTVTFASSAGSPADASTTVKGITKVSVAPATSTNPISVGDNDTRVTADQAAGTASIRTLGTGAAQAAVGNHTHAHSALTSIDTDSATTAIHHTLGTGANQAAAGNHTHTATGFTSRDWAFSGTLTTATGALRVPIHTTGTVTSIRAMVNTAPTGAAIIIDVNKNGTTLYTTQGNRPTIAVSTNAVNATVPDVTTLAAGDYLTVDIDQIGSTVAGANLVVSVRYSY